MPTRPPSPDPSGATQADQNNPFATLGAGLGAGLGFFQDWIKAAGSALPNMPGAPSAGGTGSMPSWSMPTLDPAELEKRIQDLKTVQFWLEQNARMIEMTIQGLEVQRMTLSTLKGMNVSMDALRDSLKARPDVASTPTPEPAPRERTATSGSDDSAPASANASSQADGKATPESNELINPMRWWDTLTQQFTHLASQAAQTVNDSVGESMDIIKQAQNTATEAATRGASPMKKAASAARKPAARSGAKPGSKPASGGKSGLKPGAHGKNTES